jgi:hypothetical protein
MLAWSAGAPYRLHFPLFSNATSAALSVTCAGLEFVPSIKSPSAPHAPQFRPLAHVGSSRRLSGPPAQPRFASYFARQGPPRIGGNRRPHLRTSPARRANLKIMLQPRRSPSRRMSDSGPLNPAGRSDRCFHKTGERRIVRKLRRVADRIECNTGGDVDQPKFCAV